MKKLLLILGILFCFLFTPLCVVNAEEEPTTEPEVVETENGWEKFVNRYLNAEKVALYLSWMAYIGTIIGLAANIKKLRATNNLTLKNVSDNVQEVIKTVVGKEVELQVTKFLPNVLATQEKTNDILKIFSKVLALSQENTPESRVAILQLVEELGTAGKEVIDNAKEIIKEEVELNTKHKEEIENKLDKIIEEYDGTSI